MPATVLDDEPKQIAGSGAPVQAPLRAQQGKPSTGLEVQTPDGVSRQFESPDDVRGAILRGEIPRTADIHKLGTTGGKPVTVEQWAKADSKLRSLYAPVWSMSLKGALVGLIVVGILKSLDTLITLLVTNPGAAVLWLFIGAAMYSPKWKIQLIAAVIFFGLKSGLNVMTLWGAWFGVAVFAAVFGVSSGMPVGTIVGLFRAKRTPTAPDAQPEGRKPIVWGLAVPLSAFVFAAVIYVQFVMPAVADLVKK